MTSTTATTITRRLIDLREVCTMTGLSATTIWRRVAQGTVPRPRKRPGRGSKAQWLLTDIERWCVTSE